MYRVLYHKLVLSEDFKKVSKVDQRKIVSTIKKKLANDPESFGKPLVSDLKGYFRLRIGFYRVIYSVSKKEVTVMVVKIGLRKDLKAYLEAAKRLGL
ncbi:type II toxin-antitoxin system RelE/ParE family toxin [Candidatus Peregrinibacteria bacterium]|nr:MAG: type II toxin-antitoxin system RelE/ParE family toxin [Candidatus Peregrinibacteria bacterium]